MQANDEIKQESDEKQAKEIACAQVENIHQLW
jgi:hypothetical protein